MRTLGGGGEGRGVGEQATDSDASVCTHPHHVFVTRRQRHSASATDVACGVNEARPHAALLTQYPLAIDTYPPSCPLSQAPPSAQTRRLTHNTHAPRSPLLPAPHRPTRAEATDVANAVLDGVDGILLGQETLRGCYPTESVEVVVSICRQAEKVFDHHYHFDHLLDTAYEVDERVPGATPPEAASPASSSEDLTALNHNSGGESGRRGWGMCEAVAKSWWCVLRNAATCAASCQTQASVSSSC